MTYTLFRLFTGFIIGVMFAKFEIITAIIISFLILIFVEKEIKKDKEAREREKLDLEERLHDVEISINNIVDRIIK